MLPRQEPDLAAIEKFAGHEIRFDLIPSNSRSFESLLGDRHEFDN